MPQLLNVPWCFLVARSPDHFLTCLKLKSAFCWCLHGMCSDTYLIPLDWFRNCWFCIVHARRALESSAVSPQCALHASSVTLSCSALCSVEKFSSLGLWECGGGTDPLCVCLVNEFFSSSTFIVRPYQFASSARSSATTTGCFQNWCQILRASEVRA